MNDQTDGALLLYLYAALAICAVALLEWLLERPARAQRRARRNRQRWEDLPWRGKWAERQSVCPIGRSLGGTDDPRVHR